MRRQRKDGHMEENTQKFLEKMKELVALGKKKKSILDVQEINDHFSDMELNAEQMEKVFDYLEANNIDVLRISGDVEEDVDMDLDMLPEGEEVDMENIDLSVPEGVSIEDPVRMYLKEIGKCPSLVLKGKSSWLREWRKAMKRRKRSLLKQTSVLL